MIFRVRAENFRIFSHLAYEIPSFGLVSVEGYWETDHTRSNGAGKSSFLPELLTWAIYGETSEGQTSRERVRSVVKRGEKHCSVRVELPQISWVRSQKEGNTSNEIVVDNKVFHRFQDAEQHLLSYFPSKRVFSSTIILGQGLSNKVSAWPPAERSRVLSYLFGLGTFDSAFNTCRAKIRDLQSRLSLAEGKLQALEQQRHKLGESLSDTSSLPEIENQMKTKEEEYQSMKKEHDKILSSVIKYQDRAASLSSQISVIHSNISSLDRYLSSRICPTCGRKWTLSGDKRKEYSKQKSAEKKKAVELERELKEINSILDKERPGLVVLGEKMQKVQGELGALTEQVAKLKTLGNIIDTMEAEKKAVEHDIEILTKELFCYSALERAFGPKGIPLQKMDSVIDSINISLANICNSVWDSEVLIQIVSERALKSGGSREEIDIVVEGFDGPDYCSCSPGERRRIDLSVQLALREVMLQMWKSAPQILICDDIMDVLDYRAKMQLYRNYLIPLSKNAAIFVLSPESCLPPEVPRIRIVRQEHSARIEVENCEKTFKEIKEV